MKRVLILSVTAGNGHNAIGKAIEDEWKAQGYETKFLDVFKEFSGPIRTYILDNAYLIACQHFVGPYNHFYKKLSRRDPEKWKSFANSLFIRDITPKLYNYILEYKPDAIICTHVANAIMLSNINRITDLPCKTYGVVTDYALHPFWEASTLIDYLIVPTKEVAFEAMEKGYKKQQVKEIGIPVKEKFSQPLNKTQLRKKLGLDEGVFTVLLMLGKANFGNVKKTLKSIANTNLEIQIIVVNGKNKKYEKIVNKLIAKNTFKHKILNLGFVNNIEELMGASNIVISKAGATTINEALNTETPLFMKCKMPYQEIINKNYLVNNKASVYVESDQHLQTLLRKSLRDENFLQTLHKNIKKIRKPNARKNMVEFVINNHTQNVVYNQVKLPEKTIKNRIKNSLKFY